VFGDGHVSLSCLRASAARGIILLRNGKVKPGRQGQVFKFPFYSDADPDVVPAGILSKENPQMTQINADFGGESFAPFAASREIKKPRTEPRRHRGERAQSVQAFAALRLCVKILFRFDRDSDTDPDADAGTDIVAVHILSKENPQMNANKRKC